MASQMLSSLFGREEIKISQEMIDFQRNDYVVNAITEIFAELRNEVLNNKYVKKASDMHKDEKCLQLLNKLDYTLKERFGLTFKHVASNGSGYGVYVVSPRDVDTISNTSNAEAIDYIKQILDVFKVTEANVKKKENVEVLDPTNISSGDNLSMLYHYRKAIVEIKNKMKSSSVFVDRKKAKIMGLPNEYIAYVMHDLHGYFTKADLLPEEATAVLLHEIGHAFTYIEYSYRTITNTSVLIDTFLENLDKKNRSPKESLVIAYEKSTKRDIAKEVKDKNVVSATIYIMDNYIKEHRYTITGSTHPSVDSEQLADQFAGRFGLSAEVMSALDKIIQAQFKEIDKYLWNNIFQLLLIGVILVVLAIASGIGAILGLLIVVTCILIWFSYLLATYKNPTENDPGYINTYDSLKRRYTRLRNELIRNLRNLDVDEKEFKANLVSSIEKMDKVLDAMPEDKVPMFDAIIRKFSNAAKHRVEVRAIEQMIEDLSENNLYLAAAKLQIKSK